MVQVNYTSPKSVLLSFNLKAMASAEQLNLTDISVDDLFKEYPISYVRGLHNEYNTSVKNAKAKLHSLVGQKYRDLIRIAEDIDEMSNISQKINRQIGDLSYSKSKHTVFGQNNHSRFDSMVRSKRARNARIHSQNTILNNIINNKLIGFDLKIKTKLLKSSPYLIYMAQVYHTVSCVFNQSMSSNSSSNETFATLKQNFINFLESRLAQISTTDATGSYLRDNIKSSLGSQWIEGDDIEFLVDSGEDPMSENNYEPDQIDGYKAAHYSSDPIFNYLAAYTIISLDNSDRQDLDSIARSFLSLRFAHIELQLELCVTLEPSTASNISFSALLNFIQSTQNFVREYFTSSEANEFLSFLSSISSWNATDFIGFHNWFENVDVNFDTSRYTSSSSDMASYSKVLGNFGLLLRRYYETILKLEAETYENKVSICRRAITLFYNFVCSVRKSEVFAEWNGDSPLFMESCKDFNLVGDVFQVTFLYLEDITVNHQKSLPDVLFSENSTNHKAKKDRLFTQEFVSLIDEDVTEYYRKVLDLSSFNDPVSGLQSSTDSASGLKHWFSAEKILLETSLSLNSPFIEMTLNILQKKYRNSREFGLWGDFNVTLFKSKICETRETLVKQFLSSIEGCVAEVSTNIQRAIERNEEGAMFIWLHLSLIIVSNLEGIAGSDQLKSKFKSGIMKIFLNVFSDFKTFHDSQTKIMDLLFKPETMVPGFDSATVPVRPHLIVYSAMQRVSASLLESPTYSPDELLELYLSSATKSEFVQIKNNWICDTLLNGGLQGLRESLLENNVSMQRGLYDASSASSDELNTVMDSAADNVIETPVEATSKETIQQSKNQTLSSEQSRQLLANIIFFVCLTSDKEISINNPLLTDAVLKINEMCEEAIEGSTLSIITREVSKNYLLSKEIYLPLLFN